MSPITFEAKLVEIGSWSILRIPKEASLKLPSRGIVMVEGTINGLQFQRELEPDGKKSHWFRLDKNMLSKTKAKLGDMVQVVMEVSKEWPEPEVPEDLRTALKSDSKANALWQEITPMSRWDWIRWIRSTKSRETRAIRVEKTFSKLKGGTLRPCCFNRTECTIPEISNKGILLDTEA